MEKKAIKNVLASITGRTDSQSQTEGATMEPLTGQEPVIEEMETFATRREEEELIQSIQDEELRAKLKERQNRNRRGRPRKDEASRARQKDLYTRFCALVRRDQIAKIREICLKENLTLKEVIDAILESAIDTYEEKYGQIEPRTQHGDADEIFRK